MDGSHPNYGINRAQIAEAGGLNNVKSRFISDAARQLDKAKMIRFNEMNKSLAPCDLGRTARQSFKYNLC